MATLFHLLLALVLTGFLAYQAPALAFVVRSWRARAGDGKRGVGDLLWTAIPVLIVLFLTARSWLAVFEPARPAAARAIPVTAVEVPRPAPLPEARQGGL